MKLSWSQATGAAKQARASKQHLVDRKIFLGSESMGVLADFNEGDLRLV